MERKVREEHNLKRKILGAQNMRAQSMGRKVQRRDVCVTAADNIFNLLLTYLCVIYYEYKRACFLSDHIQKLWPYVYVYAFK